MRDPRSAKPPPPRRGVLRALAHAPAALAGCAGPRTEHPLALAPAPRGTVEKDEAGAPAPAAAAAPASSAALAAIRAVPLAADAEPAFVFRAAASRPGEPR